MRNQEQRLARIFSALSNPNRVKIYNEILRSEKANFEVGHRCLLSDVVRSLKIKSPTISHHVKELVDAGLIVAEREGKFRLRCSKVCGSLHPFMLGELIVEPNGPWWRAVGLTILAAAGTVTYLTVGRAEARRGMQA